MKVVEYDPSRRGDLAGLMGRVWGVAARTSANSPGSTRKPGRGPLRCCSPRRTGGRSRPPRSASCGCRSAARAASSGCRFGSRPTPTTAAAASSPSSRPRTSGAAASSACGSCSPSRTPPRRRSSSGGSAGVRCRRCGSGPASDRRSSAARGAASSASGRVASIGRGGGDRVLRDAAWLNWRFAEAPSGYTLLEREGYAVGRASRPARHRRRGRGRPARRLAPR